MAKFAAMRRQSPTKDVILIGDDSLKDLLFSIAWR
jgi:hypothetical protein